MSTGTHSSAPRAQIDRLVERIMLGRVVPFLGAGFSQGARWEAPSDGDEPPPLRAVKIAKILKNDLLKWYEGVPSHGEAGIGDKHPLLKLEALGEVAELHSFVFSPEETVKLLRLDRWSGYGPTHAHHYLAILIREGCISEIFETNYDTFVERAVHETYGAPREDVRRQMEPAPVIHDLTTYRRHVAEPRQPRRRSALAKVVKLNGCATAYLRAPEKKADTIVLTEAQLQGWGGKHWARDLLHVAVRSKTLLFMGFGASDPIVRFHALEVMREFYQSQDDPAGPDATGPMEPRATWHQHPNAPFVAEFEPSLTFFQHQILRSFYQSQHPGSRTEVTSLDVVERNAFTGQHAAWFKAMTGESGEGATRLPADLMLGVVATETVCRLAGERYFGRQGAAQAYLQGALRFPSSLLSLVRRAFLDPTRPDLQPELARWMYLPSPGMGDGDVPPPQVSSPWSRLCFALTGSRPGRAGYRSFEDHPIELPMLLVMLYLVRLVTGRSPVPTVEELEAMLVSDRLVCLVEPDLSHGYPAVYVSRNVDGALRSDTPIRDRSVLIALTRGSLHPYVHTLWATSEDADEDGVRTRSLRHVYVISDLDALRDARPLPVDLGQAQRNLTRAIRKPDRFIQHSRGWREYCEEVVL